MQPFLPDFAAAEVLPSPNFGERRSMAAPDLLILHYTGTKTAEEALTLLRDPAGGVSSHYLVFEDGRADVLALQEELASYGYGISASGEYDQATVNVVAAFQRHFRPARVDGVADTSTRITLQKLLVTRPTVAA